jgi:hypothetical protein
MVKGIAYFIAFLLNMRRRLLIFMMRQTRKRTRKNILGNYIHRFSPSTFLSVHDIYLKIWALMKVKELNNNTFSARIAGLITLNGGILYVVEKRRNL